MNMLTSLKTLLFSSAAMKMPLAGDGSGAASPAGEVDFAVLLNGSMKGHVAVSDTPAFSAGATAKEGIVDAGADVAVSPPAAPPATDAPSIAPEMLEEPVLPAIPSIVPDISAAVERPVAAVPPVGTPVDDAEKGEATDQTAVSGAGIIADYKPRTAVDHLPEQPAIARPVPDDKIDEAEPVEGGEPADENEVKETGEDVAAVALPTVPAQPVIVAPVPEMVRPAPVDQPVMAAKKVKVAVSTPSVPAPAGTVRSSSKPEVAAQPQAEPAVPNDGTQNTVLTDKKPSIAPGKVTSKEALLSPDDEAAASPVVGTVSPSAAPAGKLARSEALSLLQMVREQFARTSPETARVPEAMAAAAHKGGRDGKPTIAEPAMPPAIAVSDADPAGATASAQPQPVATGVPAPAVAAVMPTVDVGASLGAQVVDMGVSGQWIDGLARDIAGLAQNGAHGRFQINASQLGPVQVDIRQGADGAAVSLTVANEAAEIALKQDSDRLRLDAGLAAVRIADVKIERAPHVAEAARPDGAGQSGNQQSGQQQSGQQSSSQGSASGWQGAGQGAGQGMAQSERQGQWQARENIASGHKGGADRAVINQKDAGDGAGDARRARYA